jgi:precorrin-6A/cobalt-precorrin-6A reductase
LGVPLLRLDRPGWAEPPGASWTWVDDLESAAELAPRLGERIFLSIGRQHVRIFAGVERAWLLIRCVEPPEPPLPPRSTVILDRGPFTLDGEIALLRRYQIEVLVTRDSGGAMTEAKIDAARQLGIPVVMVRRPLRPDVATVSDVAGALDWVCAMSVGESIKVTPPAPGCEVRHAGPPGR